MPVAIPGTNCTCARSQALPGEEAGPATTATWAGTTCWLTELPASCVGPSAKLTWGGGDSGRPLEGVVLARKEPSDFWGDQGKCTWGHT